MGKRFFFKLIRFLCKHSGFCLFKYEVYMQPNSKYIENNYPKIRNYHPIHD